MPTWKPSYPKNKPFKCCAAWHLQRSNLCLAIYVFLGGLTNGGENTFFSSIMQVAAYFGRDYETVRRAFKVLRKMGFLEMDAEDNYRYIPHDAMVAKNPGKCTKRELLPWQECTNPFVGKIWSISGGKIRLVEWQINLFEKFIGNEELFINEFRLEMDAATARRVPGGDWVGTSPKACYLRVFERLKGRLAKAS